MLVLGRMGPAGSPSRSCGPVRLSSAETGPGDEGRRLSPAKPLCSRVVPSDDDRDTHHVGRRRVRSHARRSLHRACGLPLRAAVRRGRRSAGRLRRRGSGGRHTSAVAARRAHLGLPVPSHDPAASRRRLPLRRTRPDRLRTLGQADRTLRLHLCRPRRLDETVPRPRSSFLRPPCSLRTGEA